MVVFRKYLVAIFLLVLVLPLSAEEFETSIVSISNPDIRVLSSKKFTWSPKSIYIYKDPRFEGFPLKETFEKDISDKLQKNGFELVSNAENANILVGYVLALESALSDMDINNLYGINPGFVSEKAEKDKYEKGTIIIDMIEARTNRLIWRGALQGLANFENSPEIREKNMKKVVDLLLDDFINKYGS